MSLDQITDELIARQPPEAQAIIRVLLARIAAQDRRIAELEARLNKSPQNSSLPPSSQHPHAKSASPKGKSKKRRGGQPGHVKRERPLLPSGDCDEIQILKPTECRRCGEKLSGRDPEPLRHQVWELPEIKPTVTEYQRHRLCCRRCGASSCAELPPGVPVGQAGPRLVALVALLMGCFRQSKSRVAKFLEQVLAQPCSTGWVVKLQNQATDALRPPYDELAQQLASEPILGIDETPTKEAVRKSWLWTFVARRFTVFRLRDSREATALVDALGSSFGGVVNCDRAKMYWRLPRLQWCWAHLKRDIQALIDDGDHQAKRLGHELMPCVRELFRLWARYRDGTLTRVGWLRLMRPVREKVDALLLRGAFSRNKRLVGMCDELTNHRAWLWTFLEVEGVEPTNNASERALRHPVIWRKLSFGTQSPRGSRFVETILTVIETCRQQSRPVFSYLTTAIEASYAAKSAPSLLPGV